MADVNVKLNVLSLRPVWTTLVVSNLIRSFTILTMFNTHLRAMDTLMVA